MKLHVYGVLDTCAGSLATIAIADPDTDEFKSFVLNLDEGRLYPISQSELTQNCDNLLETGNLRAKTFFDRDSAPIDEVRQSI